MDDCREEERFAHDQGSNESGNEDRPLNEGMETSAGAFAYADVGNSEIKPSYDSRETDRKQAPPDHGKLGLGTAGTYPMESRLRIFMKPIRLPPSESISDPLRRKQRETQEEKNKLTRLRSARHRREIARIKAIPSDRRTEAEDRTLEKHERQRLAKNQRSKERAREKKMLIFDIVNKPEHQRTQTEQDFLNHQEREKDEKNIKDRIHREFRKILGDSPKKIKNRRSALIRARKQATATVLRRHTIREEKRRRAALKKRLVVRNPGDNIECRGSNIVSPFTPVNTTPSVHSIPISTPLINHLSLQTSWSASNDMSTPSALRTQGCAWLPAVGRSGELPLGPAQFQNPAPPILPMLAPTQVLQPMSQLSNSQLNNTTAWLDRSPSVLNLSFCNRSETAQGFRFCGNAATAVPTCGRAGNVFFRHFSSPFPLVGRRTRMLATPGVSSQPPALPPPGDASSPRHTLVCIPRQWERAMEPPA